MAKKAFNCYGFEDAKEKDITNEQSTIQRINDSIKSMNAHKLIQK